MLPPPLLNCASLAKEFRTDSSAVNRALTMDCEEPEPNRRARCSQGSARIIVPFRKQGFTGPLITSHLNQPFYYVAVALLKCFKKKMLAFVYTEGNGTTDVISLGNFTPEDDGSNDPRKTLNLRPLLQRLNATSL